MQEPIVKRTGFQLGVILEAVTYKGTPGFSAIGKLFWGAFDQWAEMEYGATPNEAAANVLQKFVTLLRDQKIEIDTPENIGCSIERVDVIWDKIEK